MKSIRYLPFLAIILFLGAGLLVASTATRQEKPTVTVYKSPTCGCCNKWVDHLEENGFRVEAKDVRDVNISRAQLGVPANLRACHTAVVNGYVVEGHVPADLVMRMITEKPDIKGIGVAGMPIGSPGMEGPNPEPYEVIAFDENGKQEVYARR